MKRMMGVLFVVMGVTLFLLYKGEEKEQQPDGKENQNVVEHTKVPSTKEPEASPDKDSVSQWEAINPGGSTIQTRFNPPENYERIKEKETSFSEFVRNYPVKEVGSPVLLYDQTKKHNQMDHVAVIDMPVISGDLQQCADSVIRMYAEYYYKQKEYDKISFHFVSGFSCDFKKWADGYRVHVNGNKVSWKKTKSRDDSDSSFESYLRTVFCYASTLSMKEESEPKSSRDMKIGDVFLKGGSPGHVVMVVDLCENKDGKKAFLLAQGYMPAQQFHILKNPKSETNPWYYEEEISYPFQTPEYTFQEGEFCGLKY